jgi:uncharacterized protein
MESRKEIFKGLIKEFHGWKPPRIIKRDLRLPDWCFGLSPAGKQSMVPGFVVCISGPKRVGKTFCLFQIMEQLRKVAGAPVSKDRILYINFEDERLLPPQPSDLSIMLDAYYELYPDNCNREVFVFLDEVHLVEGWACFVNKRLSTVGTAGIFITGSSPQIISRPLPRAVPSRTVSVGLFPLNFREFLSFKGLAISGQSLENGDRFKIRYLLDEFMIYGGYPEVVLSDLSNKLRILKDYFDILVYKDMVDCYSIRNVSLLKGLLKHLLINVGSAVSLNAYYQSLLPSTKVSRETVLEYVSYLEQKRIISLVPVLSDSDKGRQVNPRRVYCVDNGLRNAVSFQLAEDQERLAKNIVYQTLVRSGGQVFYWKNGGDVDFVACEDERVIGINVVYGREMDSRSKKALLGLRKEEGKREATLTVVSRDTEMTEEGVSFIPLWKWLLAEH